MKMGKEKLSIKDENLKDKFIIIKNTFFSNTEKFAEPKTRVALVAHGFGCNPEARGTAVFVVHVIDGEEFRIERYNVERFASKEEIKEAKELNKKWV